MEFFKRFFGSLLTSTVWWLGAGVSLALYLFVAHAIEENNKVEFDYHADNAQLALQARIRSYTDVLRGAGALFSTTQTVTREQFRAYVKQLRLEESYPGITDLNFARRVSAREKKAFEFAARRETGRAFGSDGPAGSTRFTIQPRGDRPEYHILTYVEPMEKGRAALGFDVASVPRHAHALAAARDTGELASWAELIDTGAGNSPGLALRMPVYRDGRPLATLAERRAAFYGSVGAGFDLTRLMAGAVNQNTARYLRIRLYDAAETGSGDRSGRGSLLFDSAASGMKLPVQAGPEAIFVKKLDLHIGPRAVQAEFSAAKSAMLSGIEPYLPAIVLAAGLLASLLLHAIYYSLMSAQRRAVELANEMTKDLRTSEASLAEAQHMAHLGSWLLDPASGKMAWSAETYEILGLERCAGAAGYEDFLLHVHQEDRQRIRDGLENTMRTGEEFNTEHRITREDGALRWVQTIVRSAQDDRNVLRGTIMDITERKHTVEALKRSQELLRELTAHQDRVKEEERRRIAREIHDELGQTLLALRIDVSMLEARTGKSHPKLNERVRSALGHIDSTMKTIRTIINNLRPAVLDLGLTAAIEWQVNEFRRRSGIACDLVMGAQEFAVDEARATTLFRVLQESLTNVIRHANATHVLVELHEQAGRLVMRITDNGIGIYPERRKKTNSFGLVGVEERIYSLNGEFMINSAPGQGTVLTIFIPLAPETAHSESKAA